MSQVQNDQMNFHEEHPGENMMNQMLFETFMENSPAQAWIAGVDCTLYYMNRAYRETFELGNEWLLKRPEIFPAEYLRLYEENNRQVLEENRVLEKLEDGFDQLGQYRVFKVCKFPLRQKSGPPLVGAWMVELTAELKAKGALQEANQRYHYATKATADVIWEWDIKNKTVFMGEGYEALSGYPYDGDFQTLLSHVHPEDRAWVPVRLQAAIKDGDQYWQGQYRYQCKSGAIKYVMNKSYIVRDDTGAAQKVIGAVQDVTALTHLQNQLVIEQMEQNKKVVHAVIKAQERERNQIGRELHDNINQLVTAARLLVESARKEPENRDQLLARSSKLLANLLNESRALSHQLIAPSLEAEDFVIAVHGLAEMLKLAGIVHTSIRLPSIEELQCFSADVKLCLYRIVQEQLKNIIKHSQASRVSVLLMKGQKTWQLEICDNGVGFDVQQKKIGIGLKNIKSRLEIFDGCLELCTAPGKGCTLRVELPQ